jgi:hypothetical protein
MVGIMKVVRVLQAAAAGALILAASGAAAQDEGVAVKSLLGAVGIIPKDKPPIEYRERPPLVVPPKLELRPPVASGSVRARAANWPQDPDMLARREEEEDARRPAGERRADRGSRINATMTSEEIRAGTRPGAAGTVANPVQHEKNATLSPSEMARMDRRKPPELASTEEPDRRNLTDPPAGYRKPNPNAMRASVEPAPEDTSIFSGFRRWIGADR